MTVTEQAFDVEWCCWAASGWEDAPEGSIRDARTTTRGQAAAFVASETTGDIRGVRVWKRHIAPYSRQWMWQGAGRDRWADDHEQANPHLTLAECHAAAPSTPPAAWQPNEYDPAWRFVHRSHPDAIPVWVVGLKGDEPPANPAQAPALEGK